MIDHVFGRPSTRFRKWQVFTVVLVWSVYLRYTDQHGPPFIRRLSRYLSKRVSTWRAFVVFCLSFYVSRNFARVVGLESPEPLANLYTRNYFRATWVTTALDAGFWTAMNLRPKWIKDLASIVFTVYYLVCAEQADEMVRKVRGGLTLQHLRVSWDKGKTPYIASINAIMRPLKLMKYKPRALRIHRPVASNYTEPIDAWLYFDGPKSELKQHDKIILDIPGGGFVAMDPRCHDDKLMAWAGKTGLPVLALDYKKAPEHPYPYALNECYDAYHTLVTTRGRCIGLSGTQIPKIVVSGDSAGGNLAVGLILMLLQESPHSSYFPEDSSHRFALPLPEAAVLVYPALDVNISNWMTDEQMALIKAPERRRANEGVLRQKSDDYRRLTPDTPHGSDDDVGGALHMSSGLRRTVSKSAGTMFEGTQTSASSASSASEAANGDPEKPKTSAAHTVDSSSYSSKPQPLRTRLAMSSMISYFNDRILSPEMLRAMIILYIGPYNRPDFATDHLLSPLLAPEALLARFPKTYMLTGERDPLVDDTVIFAGRLRQAHLQRWQERKELGLVKESEQFDESHYVEVKLIPGISHGFLQFVSVFPDGWQYIYQCSRWMKDVFAAADARDQQTPAETPMEGFGEGRDYFGGQISPTERRKRRESSDQEDRPLEMTSLTPLNANGRPRGFGKSSSGRGQVRKPAFSGRRSPIATRRSLVRLSSATNLMERRMHGLAGGLMGDSPVGGLRTP